MTCSGRGARTAKFAAITAELQARVAAARAKLKSESSPPRMPHWHTTLHVRVVNCPFHPKHKQEPTMNAARQRRVRSTLNKASCTALPLTVNESKPSMGVLRLPQSLLVFHEHTSDDDALLD